MSASRDDERDLLWVAESAAFDWPASSETSILAVDYGGTHARAGIFLSEPSGGYRCVRRASVEHSGRRERLDAFIESAGTMLRATWSRPHRVLAIGCKGPTDIGTGWTHPEATLPWPSYNVREHYRAALPGVFTDILAMNDLVAHALGVAVSEDLRRQLAALEMRDFPDPLAVVCLGTGAGYKVLHADDRPEGGGEIAGLYASPDPELPSWLFRKYTEASSRGALAASRYAPSNERFVTGPGLGVLLEYVLDRSGDGAGELPEGLLQRGASLPAAVSRLALDGHPMCVRVFELFAAHLAALVQQVVLAHRPRVVVLSGPSVLLPNLSLILPVFEACFRCVGGVERPHAFPYFAANAIEPRSWFAETSVLVSRASHPGTDGAAYLASRVTRGSSPPRQ